MAISKVNVAHDHGENVTSKSVCRSYNSTSQSRENAMQNPTNDWRFSDELTSDNPVLHE